MVLRHVAVARIAVEGDAGELSRLRIHRCRMAARALLLEDVRLPRGAAEREQRELAVAVLLERAEVLLADHMRRISRRRPDFGRLADRTHRPGMRIDEPRRADLVAMAEQAGIAGGIVATALLRRCGGQARQQQRSEGQSSQWQTLFRPVRFAW